MLAKVEQGQVCGQQGQWKGHGLLWQSGLGFGREGVREAQLAAEHLALTLQELDGWLWSHLGALPGFLLWDTGLEPHCPCWAALVLDPWLTGSELAPVCVCVRDSE